jgi:hypothetical protein
MLRYEASRSAGIIKHKEIYLHPGKLIAGIFFGTSICTERRRNIHGNIVVSLTCEVYQLGTFIEAEIV